MRAKRRPRDSGAELVSPSEHVHADDHVETFFEAVLIHIWNDINDDLETQGVWQSFRQKMRKTNGDQ